MKRFKWSLQRLLDVTVQRELAERAEMLRLSREIAAIRGHILSHRAILRELLDDLAREEIRQRIKRQQLIFESSQTRERQISKLEDRLKDLESQRREKTDKFIKTRNFREALERKRDEARRLYVKEQLKIEQKQLDEGSHISLARRALASRLSEVS